MPPAHEADGFPLGPWVGRRREGRDGEKGEVGNPVASCSRGGQFSTRNGGGGEGRRKGLRGGEGERVG